MPAESTSTLNSLLAAAQTIVVFFADNASTDVVLSAVSFAQGLASLGKSVTVASPQPVANELQQFSGVTDIAQELGNKNLDVSFPYQEDQVDKVSYNIDEEAKTFHLVIQPKKGVRPLDTQDVKFTFTGAEADLIVTFGIDQLDQLGQLYSEYQDLFQAAPIISFNSDETSFGTLKLSTAGSASYAEVVAYVLQELSVTLSPDMATNLLAGIESATQTFRSLTVTAQTFETAAKLLEAGARRVRLEELPHEQPAKFAQAISRNIPKSDKTDKNKNLRKLNDGSSSYSETIQS